MAANPGGVVVAFAGVLLAFQVFGGDALGRLGLVSSSSGSSSGGAQNAVNVTPAPAGGPSSGNPVVSV